MTRVSVYGGECERLTYPELSKFPKTDLKKFQLFCLQLKLPSCNNGNV